MLNNFLISQVCLLIFLILKMVWLLRSFFKTISLDVFFCNAHLNHNYSLRKWDQNENQIGIYKFIKWWEPSVNNLATDYIENNTITNKILIDLVY